MFHIKLRKNREIGSAKLKTENYSKFQPLDKGRIKRDTKNILQSYKYEKIIGRVIQNINSVLNLNALFQLITLRLGILNSKSEPEYSIFEYSGSLYYKEFNYRNKRLKAQSSLFLLFLLFLSFFFL